MIHTQHLLLSDKRPTLVEMIKIVAWLNNPDITRFSEQRHISHTLESQTEYLREFHQENLYLLIRLRGDLIGTMTAHYDAHNNIYDVGIMLGLAQGNGYGFEAWQGLCNHLLIKAAKVEAGCMGSNIPMIRICEKYKMKLEGVRKNHFAIKHGHNQRTDMMLYGKQSDGKTTKI